MLKRWILEAIGLGDVSLNERMDKIRRAVSAKFNQGPGDYCYPEVYFDDHVILCKSGALWRVDLEWDAEGNVELKGDAKKVRIAYPLVTTEAVNFGGVSSRLEGQILGLLPDGDAEPVTEGEAPKATGKRWGILIIQEGMSKNRNRYGKAVLTKAAPLYEGAKIYIDHAESQRRYGRSVHEQAGYLKDVKPALLTVQESAGAEPKAVFALAATAFITKQDIRREMLEAYEDGNADLYGFSHDAMCRSVTVLDANQVPFYDITEIESVSSVDLVTNPAAGGRVLRLVASNTTPRTLSEDGTMLQKMIEAIRKSGNAALVARLEAIGAEPNEDQVLAIYQDVLKSGSAPAKEATATVTAPAATPEKTPAATPAPEAVKTTEAKPAARQITEAEYNEVLGDSRTSFLDAQLAGCALHEIVKERIRGEFTTKIAAGHIPTKEAITARIKEDVDFFGKLAEKNIVQPAAGVPRFEVTKGRRDKVVESLDAFFGVVKDDKARGGYRRAEGAEDRPMMSFRNLYVDITGDRDVTGRISEATRLTESLSSSTFDQILGDSIARRMVADYNTASQAVWRGTIAEVVPVADFRTQRRMRFGGYGNLSTVAQGAPYPSMTSPTDEEATYAAAKRGGTEQITLEMIANDDVGAIRRIPQKMGRAASQTIYEFVFDFMRTNAAIYDSTALAAAGHGNNISTTALSNTQLGVLRLAIKNQTDMSNSKRIGLASRYLWVPSDLEELAFWLCTSDRALPDSSIPGTAASGAPNFQRKINLQPITVDYWTDTNNYWVTSSVQDTPMIEIGFLSGREEPELFIQDMANVGSLFSNDVITYKIRHIYGGAVIDYRGFAGGIVA